MKIEILKQVENRKVMEAKQDITGGVVILKLQDERVLVISLSEISGIRNTQHFEDMDKEDREDCKKFTVFIAEKLTL